MSRTVWPTKPGTRPVPADNARDEHAALIKRILHGHDGVPLVLWDEAEILIHSCDHRNIEDEASNL